jgi:HEAT repeat protein
MRRLRLIAIAVLLAAAVVAAISTRLHARPAPEPTFAGRTVTQWLFADDYRTNRAAVTTAVVALGEGAVPALRRMLHSGTRLERLWFACAPNWLCRRLPFGGSQFDHKARAMWALETLGPTGRAAIPDLLKILQDTTECWNQRSGAITTLRRVQAEPAIVIPVMDKLTSDPVVGRFAASEAQALRRVVEFQRQAEIQRSLDLSRSTATGAQKPAFQPSSAFLDKSPLWGPEKPQPASSSQGSPASHP